MPELLTRPEESEEKHRFHAPLEGADEEHIDQLFNEPQPHVEGGGAERHIVLPREAHALYEHSLHRPEVRFHLQALKEQDRPTYEHSIRVSQNFAALAWMNRHLEGLSAQDIAEATEAAHLHDIGKLELPVMPQVDDNGKPTGEMVLPQNFNGELTPEEKKQVKMNLHPMLTARRLQREHPVENPRILGLAILHHQIQDNPTMSAADAEAVLIDLGIRDPAERKKLRVMQQMLEVADKFDAMDSKRPYRDGNKQREMTPKKIEGILRENFGKYGGDTKFIYQIMDLYYPDRYESAEYQNKAVSR